MKNSERAANLALLGLITVRLLHLFADRFVFSLYLFADWFVFSLVCVVCELRFGMLCSNLSCFRIVIWNAV